MEKSTRALPQPTGWDNSGGKAAEGRWGVSGFYLWQLLCWPGSGSWGLVGD